MSGTPVDAADVCVAAPIALEDGTVPNVIIDTDPGIDDAMALLLALSAHKRGTINIIGLTITHGNNNDVDLMAKNACFLLAVAGLSDAIPVYKGCDGPIATDYHGHSGILVHGPNGMGGVPLPLEPSLSPISPDTTAAEFLVSACTAAPGTVTLITLGPLSNIATAISASPAFAPSVKRLYVMAGDTLCTGNKAPGAEANVHNDPEAAKLVFQNFPDIILAGLNATKHVHLSDDFRARIRDECGPVGAYLFSVTQHYIDLLTSWGATVLPVHDAMAVMALLYPALFAGSRVCVDVETKGEITRGATIADWYGHWKRHPQTFVIKSADQAAFHALYVDHLKDFAGVTFP